MCHEPVLMRHSVLGCVPKLKIYPDRILQWEIGKEMVNETPQTEWGLFSVCESGFLEGDPEDLGFVTSIFNTANNHLILFYLRQ